MGRKPRQPNSDGEIRCPRCQRFKPLSAFGRNAIRNLPRSYCWECERKYNNERNEKNPERTREISQKWYAKNPDYIRKKRAPFQEKYGVSYAQLHHRVYVARGAANTHECSCGQQARDWASLTSRYDDINDYSPMCRKCHRAYERETA